MPQNLISNYGNLRNTPPKGFSCVLFANDEDERQVSDRRKKILLEYLQLIIFVCTGFSIMPSSQLPSFSELLMFDTMQLTAETDYDVADAELLAFLDADFAYAPDFKKAASKHCESANTIDDHLNVDGTLKISTSAAPARQATTPVTTNLGVSLYTTVSPSSSVCGTDVEFKTFDEVNPSEEANFGGCHKAGIYQPSGAPGSPSRKRLANESSCASLQMR